MFWSADIEKKVVYVCIPKTIFKIVFYNELIELSCHLH